MVDEVVALLAGAEQILDCTLGGGGHSEALLAAGSSVVALDRDEAAITEARKRLAPYEATGRFLAIRGNFGEIDRIQELDGRNFDAILGAFGPRMGPGDFARLFQAVRIAVNDELTMLEKALPLLRDKLKPGGRLAVIAYHSGEDRLVKHTMREWSSSCICPPKQLQCTCRGKSLGELITKRAITAGPDETALNPRSRSARLRAWQSAA